MHKNWIWLKIFWNEKCMIKDSVVELQPFICDCTITFVSKMLILPINTFHCGNRHKCSNNFELLQQFAWQYFLSKQASWCMFGTFKLGARLGLYFVLLNCCFLFNYKTRLSMCSKRLSLNIDATLLNHFWSSQVVTGEGFRYQLQCLHRRKRFETWTGLKRSRLDRHTHKQT